MRKSLPTPKSAELEVGVQQKTLRLSSKQLGLLERCREGVERRQPYLPRMSLSDVVVMGLAALEREIEGGP